MGYYRTCPICGASLDPGEICDCQTDELAIQEAIYRGTFSVEAYQGAMSALVAKAEAVRDQTQQAVDELTSAYRLIAG